jgi:Ca2+-transporting ATPase
MVTHGENGRKLPSTTNSSGRQRAPTITIDTSAVSPPVAEDGAHPLVFLSDHPQAPLEEYKEIKSDVLDTKGHTPSERSPTELRPSNSFDSRDSRPTSPHNISSPVSKWSDKQPQNFLSVPTARSRGNSVDSDDILPSPTSYGGDTYIPSPNSSQHGDTQRNSNTAHSQDPLLSDEDALKPDPGTEGDFEVQNNPFAFSPGQLGKLFNPKSLGAFHALGGLRGLEKGLRTDRLSGLSVDEKKLDGSISFEEATSLSPEDLKSKDDEDPALARTATTGTTHMNDDSFLDRKRVFSDNVLPEKKAKSIFELAWLAYNDKVLILLTVAAVISLALGIYQSVTVTDGEAPVQWVEGVAIVVAIVIVVVVGAANDWQKERQFVKLNKKKEDRTVKVIRSGKSREISVHDVLVGDVIHIEPGDMIPCDGIFISGYNVTCDESSATGESDLLKKIPGAEVYKVMEAHGNISKLDPFIISGSKVNEGIGTFLVTAVGVNSCHGKTMMSLREDAQTTPLQSKLNVLAEYIAKLGLAAGLLLFVVTFIEFLARLSRTTGGASAKGQQFLNVFIVAVTVVVVAVPEGLPLAVTLALAFATTRMLKDNNLVRLLRACETMGNATTICSDKTGTLTQNKMSVVAGTLGVSSHFGKSGKGSSTASSAQEGDNEPQKDEAPVSSAEFVSSLSDDVKELLKQSIVANTTAFEGGEDKEESFVGSKTETALLSFARDHLAMGSVGEERSNVNVVQLIPFDSGRKCMATAVKLDNGKYRLYVKGASELMLAKCQKIIRDPTQGLAEIAMTTENMETLTAVISTYASRSLRTIGLLYKDFEQWPPKGYADHDDPKMAAFDKVFREMVFIGTVGLQDPLRVGVAEAVKACQNAGVFVRMVTGDNILTAKAIATECGIYTPGGVVMEGPQFRRLTKTQMNQTIPRLQVLARSSPDDKRILVKRLKELGETVAVTGKGWTIPETSLVLTYHQGTGPTTHQPSRLPTLDSRWASQVLRLPKRHQLSF